jgi:hypothetical protein
MTKIIIFGYNESEYLGEGWNERSLVRNSITARTTSKSSSLIIPINNEINELSIIASASVDIIKKPIYGIVRVNNIKVGEFRLEDESWKLLKFELKVSSEFKVSSDKKESAEGVVSEQKVLKIDIITENAFVVNDYLKNGDMRTFGIHISCVKLK